MQDLSERLRSELTSMGASLVGFADLTGLPAEVRDGYNFAVSIAVALSPEIVNEIGIGPVKAYYDEYYEYNRLLDSLALKAAEIIKEAGFSTLPITRANTSINYHNHSTILPHKTIATRSGLGWIGKCALLVTEEYGTAVRLTSVLTDAPLRVNVPINESRCGSCDRCVSNCPGEALTDVLWSVETNRAQFYDHIACRKKAVERTWRISPGETHCGLCVLVCPWTKRFITSSGIEYKFPAVDVASKGDLEEILTLQQLAYQSEASIYNNYEFAPLKQSLEELQSEAKQAIVLKIVEDRKIVGSVRGFEKDGTCFIGRLIVHPDYQNQGLGKKLMHAIELCYEGVRYELFTGHLSEKNLRLYENLGYKIFDTKRADDHLQLVYMEKQGV